MIIKRVLLLISLIMGACAAIMPVLAAVASESDIELSIAQADEVKAKKIALQCIACHSVEEGAQQEKLGPNLWGIVSRPIASDPSYDYSTALSGKGGSWNSQALNEFLRAPNNFAPGTKMVLPGITDLNTRAHIIRYLHSLSANPLKFEPNTQSLEQSNNQAGLADPFGNAWPLGEGRELTGYACISCHSLAIVKQQGQTQEGWSELIDWMIEEQGMSELDQDERESIVNYLSANFNIDSERN